MKKSRSAIPAATRNELLTEFSHRCAICGESKPHLHHIDEDPTNNKKSNLIPLCPNCHLVDHHSPTAEIEPKKLALFRLHKDPVILSPEFEPLFRRLKFLLDLGSYSFDGESISESAEELVRFVQALEMGQFYGRELSKLIAIERTPRIFSERTTDAEFNAWRNEENDRYREKLNTNQTRAIVLLIELLRYQHWGRCNVHAKVKK